MNTKLTWVAIPKRKLHINNHGGIISNESYTMFGRRTSLFLCFQSQDELDKGSHFAERESLKAAKVSVDWSRQSIS
ncbi:hypothetical protein [Vibrio owensii]|uniref:hypothetical protein n=1 Tax=Vibrio owensii TaxID=696485 RepID=UPI004067CDE1